MPDEYDHIHQAVREGRFDDAREDVESADGLRPDDVARFFDGIAHAEALASKES